MKTNFPSNTSIIRAKSCGLSTASQKYNRTRHKAVTDANQTMFALGGMCQNYTYNEQKITFSISHWVAQPTPMELWIFIYGDNPLQESFRSKFFVHCQRHLSLPTRSASPPRERFVGQSLQFEVRRQHKKHSKDRLRSYRHSRNTHLPKSHREIWCRNCEQ